MINWQPPSTTPKDTSYFAVLTILGDLEGWTYNRERLEFEVWHVPGFGKSIKTTTSTIKGWARWNEVIDRIKG